MMDAITSFRGEYRWLSNFWPANVFFDGVVYPTVEHAYVAAKTDDPQRQREVLERCRTPGDAKRFGRSFPVRPGWDEEKIGVMHGLLKQKFAQSELRDLLIATHPRELIEGNTWNDRFWGVCNGRGENHLGKLLMKVRTDAIFASA